MTDALERFDLAVIGGGTAGIVAVSEALALGMGRIALIERRRELGGECAMNACVPYHTMNRAAAFMHAIQKEAPAYGITVPEVHLDWRALMDKVAQVRQSGPSLGIQSHPDVTRIQGSASFVSPHELEVSGRRIRAEKILVATGARPVIPPIDGLSETGFLLYSDITHLERLPESLLIIGGGRVGIEMAQLLARFGCRVTLIERRHQLLHREEPEAAEAIRHRLQEEGITVLIGCEIIRVHSSAYPPGKTAWVIQSGQEGMFEVTGQSILVAAGRSGIPEDLHPQAAGLLFGERGLLIDSNGRTNVPHIWAAGDITGPYRFTHIADFQAVVAVQDMLGLPHQALDYQNIPIAYYTDPTFARVGLTEAQARAMVNDVIVLRADLDSVTRYRVESRLNGFIKVLVDGDTDLILGGHIMADRAEDPVHLLAMAMHVGLTVPQMTRLVYAYPTQAQVVQKALEPYRDIKAQRRRRKAESSPP